MQIQIIIDGLPTISPLFSFFFFIFPELREGWHLHYLNMRTLRVGNEGLPAWGQSFPDGSWVQLDQAYSTMKTGGEE